MPSLSKSHPHRTLGLLLGAPLLALLMAMAAPPGCPSKGHTANAPCRLDRDCKAAQLCQSGTCVDKQVCGGDQDCKNEQRCDALSGACVFRTGFCSDCGPNNGNTVCSPGQFCSLGCCQDTAAAVQCSRRLQCPGGEVCDRLSFYCIAEAPCTLATADAGAYPELACDPGETCDVSAHACVGSGQGQCEPTAVPTGCGLHELCNGARRCVQCISNQDCGAGLRCNTRAGLCESSNTCRSDSECHAPLVCDRTTAVCSVPLPPCTSDFNCGLGQFCDRVSGTCQYKEGKCVDDRFEEDDTTVNAREVNLSNAVAVLNDLMLCSNDPDVFKTTLAAGDALTVVMDGVRVQANAELWVLAPEATGGGIRTLRYAQAPPRGNGTVSFVAEADGVYFVRALSLAGQSAYTLTFTRTQGSACAPDAFDAPPAHNNLPGTAGTVSPGAAIPLTLCVDDVDWFVPASSGEFSLGAGEALTVALRGPPNMDFDLELTNDTGDLVLAQSAGPTAWEDVRYRTGVPRNVLIHVFPYGPSFGAYTLAVGREGPVTCVPDGFEGPVPSPLPDPGDGGVAGDDAGLPDLDAGNTPDAAFMADAAGLDSGPGDAGPVSLNNNVQAQATPVGREGLEANLSVCLGDEDWFVVDALGYQRVVAQASWRTGDNGVQVEAYDAQGVLMMVGRGGVVTALSVPGNAAGKVYLRVVSPGGQSGYHLSVLVERALDCTPDQAEPNNTAAMASPPALAVDGVYTVCSSDLDLFRVEAGAGKRVVVSVDFSTADGDLDLALLLPDGITPLAVSDGLTGHEELSVVLPANPPDGGFGAYFISVYAARSGAHAPYHVQTQVFSH